MTTIACNRFMMAGDSMISSGNVKATAARPKIWRWNGKIIGASGTSAEIERWRQWYEAGSDPEKCEPDEDNRMNALILDSCGIREVDCLWNAELLAHDFWAIGSGRDFALMAMHLGKEPHEAIEETMNFDVNTGPPVRKLELCESTEFSAVCRIVDSQTFQYAPNSQRDQ